MRVQSLTPCFALTLTLVAVAIRPARLEAAGCYNTPSNFCQCMGYGCGGGYHAPLVMGPVTCENFFARNQVRLPYAPCATCSCWGCNGVSERPTTMEGFVSTGTSQRAKQRIERSTAEQKREQLPVVPMPTAAPAVMPPPAAPVNVVPVSTEPEARIAEPTATPQIIVPPPVQPETKEPEKAPSLIAPPAALSTTPVPAAESPIVSAPPTTIAEPLFDAPVQP